MDKFGYSIIKHCINKVDDYYKKNLGIFGSYFSLKVNELDQDLSVNKQILLNNYEETSNIGSRSCLWV